MRSVFVGAVSGAALAGSAFADAGEHSSRFDWVDLSVAGRLQFDALSAQGLNGVDVNEGFVRRVETFFVFDFANDVRLRVQPIWIPSAEEARFNDLFLQFKLGDTQFRVGHFQHLTLDQATSAALIFDQERFGGTEAFDVSRKLGAMASWTEVNRSLDVAITGQPLHAANDALDNQWAVSARGTWQPIIEFEKVLHLGGNIRLRDSGSDDAGFRYRARPGFREVGRYLDTDHAGSPLRGDPATSDIMVGGEVAWSHGPLLVSFEGYRTSVLEGADYAADAADLNIGWHLTGEHHAIRRGRILRPKPKHAFDDGGFGAVQIKTSLEWLNLTNNGVEGGTQLTVKSGFGWTLNETIRIYAEHVYSDIDGGDGDVFNGDTQALQIRVGLDF